MKKSMLLAMPKLTASPEMKNVAMADAAKQHTSAYGHTYTDRKYGAYMNCLVQDGILKAAIYLPDHLRLDGDNPAFEVFLDKESRQFLTYDQLEKKWRDAKLDRLEWPGKNYYSTYWIGKEDAAMVQKYFGGARGDLTILDFQRNVRDEQLEQRHKRITDHWDKDLAQVPGLPRDWTHWVDKVAVRENFIFYHYKRGGAKTGYCTFCGKEVPITGHPYHNKKGRCSRCRHPVVFKALGRTGYIQTKRHYAYLIQRCKDGFIVREFRTDRTYRKETLPHSKVYWHEIRRAIYDRSGEIRAYCWGMFKQRYTRWIADGPCSYGFYYEHIGRIYGKSLPSLEKKELRSTGLVQWVRSRKETDPEKYLAVWRHLPQMEQIWKAGLSELTKECFQSCHNMREYIKNPDTPGLIRALGLDAKRFQRLRQMNGGMDVLEWLQYEKQTGRPIPDGLLRWFCQEDIDVGDISFVHDRMSPLQIYNYLQKQKRYFRNSCRQTLTTWQDYLLMAKKLHIDTSDEIVYRARKLRERHNELVMRMHEKDIEIQAEEVAEKFPMVNGICQNLKSKYEYAGSDYLITAPKGILDIITEGRALNHCVDTHDRYWDRIERRESYVLFLRKVSDPTMSYYTLEIEPDGTIRQKRTEFDRQNEDIEQATEFLQRWQTVITPRLTAEDLKLAERSRVLRAEEIIQMQKDRVVIHTGHLAGHLLAEVLLADLMENKEVMQQQALPAAA